MKHLIPQLIGEGLVIVLLLIGPIILYGIFGDPIPRTEGTVVIDALENLINAVEGNNGDPGCDYHQLHAIEAAKEALKKGKYMLHAIENLSYHRPERVGRTSRPGKRPASRGDPRNGQGLSGPRVSRSTAHLLAFDQRGHSVGQEEAAHPQGESIPSSRCALHRRLLNDEPIDPAEVARAA